MLKTKYQVSGTIHQENGSIYQENGRIHQENGSIYQESGRIHQENGSIYQENGRINQENVTIHQENGSIYQENGTILLGFHLIILFWAEMAVNIHFSGRVSFGVVLINEKNCQFSRFLRGFYCSFTRPMFAERLR